MVSEAVVPLYLNATITPFAFSRENNSSTGAVYDRDGNLIRESLRTPVRRLNPNDPPTAPAVDGARRYASAVYCGHLFDHFGHFLTETLPQSYWARLEPQCVIYHPWTGGTRKRLLGSSVFMAFLRAAQIDPANIVIADQPLVVDRLYVPERTNFIVNGEVRLPEKLRIYSEVSEYFGASDGPERVFLSRRAWRRERNNLENQVEIEERFSALGFSVVSPEQLSVEDQVQLVHNARIIAGELGSALHLGVFMKPGSLVIGLGHAFDNLVRFNDAVGVRTALLDVIRESHVDMDAVEQWVLANT